MFRNYLNLRTFFNPKNLLADKNQLFPCLPSPPKVCWELEKIGVYLARVEAYAPNWLWLIIRYHFGFQIVILSGFNKG